MLHKNQMLQVHAASPAWPLPAAAYGRSPRGRNLHTRPPARRREEGHHHRRRRPCGSAASRPAGPRRPPPCWNPWVGGDGVPPHPIAILLTHSADPAPSHPKPVLSQGRAHASWRRGHWDGHGARGLGEEERSRPLPYPTLRNTQWDTPHDTVWDGLQHRNPSVEASAPAPEPASNKTRKPQGREGEVRRQGAGRQST